MKPLRHHIVFNRCIRIDTHHFPYGHILTCVEGEVKFSFRYNLRIAMELEDAIETMRTL